MTQDAARGLFITFEGGEGAGKSTLARALGDLLLSQGQPVLYTREPGGTLLGEKVRELVLHAKDIGICPLAELFLFLASRAQHIQDVITPALNQKKIVLCDRFSDSSIAYQGAGNGLGFSFVSDVCTLALASVVPDLTFYVDIDPKLGLARTDARRRNTEGRDRIERQSIEFHERVRTAFLRLSREFPDRIYVLDGTKSIDELVHEAYTRVLECNKG